MSTEEPTVPLTHTDDPLTVQVGMFLQVPRNPHDQIDRRIDLWVVKSIRRLAKTHKVTLIGYPHFSLERGSPSAFAEATASFPGGIVQEPWRLFRVSDADREALYDAAAVLPGPKEVPDGSKP